MDVILPLLLLSLLVLASAATAIADASLETGLRGADNTTDASVGSCKDPAEGCVDEHEDDMASAMTMDVVRRTLARRGRYISYGALRKDRVPCNRRGRSYYSCGRSGRANPYRRGCSAITHCARATG